MRETTSLPDSGLEWLDAHGPFADIVLSTRVRLARNLEEHRFGLRADDAEREEILTTVRAAAQRTSALGEGILLPMGRLSDPNRRLLLERHLVSKELIGEAGREPPSYSALILARSDSLG